MSPFNRVRMTSYYCSTATMGISRTVSEIDSEFCRKSQKFSIPLYVAPPLKGFPLELGTSAGEQKTRMMGLPGRERSSTISSDVWTQCTNVTDGQTDGQRDTGRRQRLVLRIASRDKNVAYYAPPLIGGDIK